MSSIEIPEYSRIDIKSVNSTVKEQLLGEEKQDQKFLQYKILSEITRDNKRVCAETFSIRVHPLFYEEGDYKTKGLKYYYKENHVIEVENLTSAFANDTCDYIICFILIDCYNNELHSNVAIYNKNTNELIYFEPWGFDKLTRYEYELKTKKRELYRIQRCVLNYRNRDFLSKIFEAKLGIIPKLVEPSSYCPVGGKFYQTLGDEIERENGTLAFEYSGWCFYWSLIFIELFLLNPYTELTTLTRLFTNAIKIDPDEYVVRWIAHKLDPIRISPRRSETKFDLGARKKRNSYKAKRRIK